MSTNEHDWLGNGAYFFQDAPLRAWLWAKREERRRGVEAAVVAADLELGACLDLLDVKWAPFVRHAYQTMVRAYVAKGMPVPNQLPPTVHEDPRADFALEDSEPTFLAKGVGRNQLDCHVFNFSVAYLKAKLGLQIDSIRGAFQEGFPIYRGSFAYDRAHVQIAVLNVEDVIKSPPREISGDDLEAQRIQINKTISDSPKD